MSIRIQTAAGMAVGVLLCGLFVAPSAAAQTSNSSAAKDDASAAVNKRAAYCTKTGGEVEYRRPYYNTNSDPSQWLVLAGGEEFCQYTKGKGDNSSRIHVSLNTLTAKEPSLAALAYYALVPWNGQGNGNPASFYCTQLGGSDSFGGVNPFGGGWVKFRAIDEVLEACIFPDNSTIDSWGLLYHSVGIIRGRNLANVLKFKNPYAAASAATRD
jgi:putative hemolysin